MAEVLKDLIDFYNELSKGAGADKFRKEYPILAGYATPVKRMTRPLIGRDKQLTQLKAGLMRPELCNVLLLGEAGSGKTALVQGAMASDTNRLYLEIDLARMISDLRDNNEMAAKIKMLFDDTAKFVKTVGIEVVLFIDEFHQIITLSSAAVEALKPMLADSGTRGIRVIVATTFGEFREYVSKNQALIERLQRIELVPPDTGVVVQILKGFAKVYGVEDQIHGTYLYEQIVDLTNRYVPANSQPRKSILLLDMMVGWHRAFGYEMSVDLLHKVLEDSEGIKLDVGVDAVSFKRKLDSRVFSQGLATTAVASRLQICASDLNDKTKPMASFLFTGSTGVGKALVNSANIPVWTDDNSVHIKQNGALQVGDYVFNRYGEPVRVTGVYPQGKRDVYEVELTDGRKLLCNSEHIWTYKSRFGNGAKSWRNATTKELMDEYSNKYHNTGRSAHNIKFVIPMNQPVQWSEMNYKLHPYVVGTILGNGCLTGNTFTISSNDEENVARVAALISAVAYRKDPSNYSWYFYTGQKTNNGKDACFLTSDVLSEIPELKGVYSGDKFIPDIYKYGSIDQRWELIKGLFDTNGTVDKTTGRFNVSYSTCSKRLAEDIQSVLYSLGVSSTITCYKHTDKSDGYDLNIKIGNPDKEKFFYLSRKRKIAQQATLSDASKTRVKKFGDVIGIRDIRKLDYQEEMTCIMVDDDEHLYQAGDFVVTHNTELTKAMAELLFGDDTDHLIRFDMTEYSQDSSIERFRTELTTKVWEHPYSVVLFDEIEKACGSVTRLLLGVLDDGRLIDQNNRVVSFLNCYLILTTNAAAEIYETVGSYANTGDDDASQIKTFGKYMKTIRRAISEGQGANRFPPELLGRIDEICPFMPLSDGTQEKILKTQMEKFKKEVWHKHNIRLDYDEAKLLRYIIYDKLDTEASSGGARIVKTNFQNEVIKEVARVINISKDKGYNHIAVKVEGDMAVDHTDKLESEAVVRAFPVKDGKLIEV